MKLREFRLELKELEGSNWRVRRKLHKELEGVECNWISRWKGSKESWIGNLIVDLNEEEHAGLN